MKNMRFREAESHKITEPVGWNLGIWTWTKSVHHTRMPLFWTKKKKKMHLHVFLFSNYNLVAFIILSIGLTISYLVWLFYLICSFVNWGSDLLLSMLPSNSELWLSSVTSSLFLSRKEGNFPRFPQVSWYPPPVLCSKWSLVISRW